MKILITGGCGFIGRNAAERFLGRGDTVTVLDNLSRPGSDRNLSQLVRHPKFSFEQDDIRNAAGVANLIRAGSFDAILHLAGQVAVTTSMINPRHDFDVNATGALNILEAVREHSPETVILNAATNKVYGELTDLTHGEEPLRYTLPSAADGISEVHPLDFHSPYGCSKGAADQYMIDYSRCFGLRTVSLRQSCIYGYWQFGIEDQGWVAWFIIAHLTGRPIKIFGTGKQVRDVLFIEDLLDCYEAALANIDKAAGNAFNVGGGPSNTLSLLEFMRILEDLSGRPVEHSFAGTRPGDQPVFISDVRKAQSVLGWEPRTRTASGIERLYRWVEANAELFEGVPAQTA